MRKNPDDPDRVTFNFLFRFSKAFRITPFRLKKPAMKFHIPLMLLLMAVSPACRKTGNGDVEPYKGKDYFPVNSGHEVTYDVVDITKDQTTGLWDTLSYQVKEVIAGSYTDADGRETKRIERYMKNDSTAGFVLYKIWAANLLTSTAHRVEDSIRYIKLNFPQNAGVTWDGNSLNSLADRFYRYTELHVPLTLGALTFDSTCTVLQFQESNAFQDALFLEKYATNVGMIYKINKEIIKGGTTDTIWARIHTETLVSFVK